MKIFFQLLSTKAGHKRIRNKLSRWAFVFWRRSQSGAVECLCCGWSGSGWWGDEGRKICPKCGSAERHRFWLYIVKNRLATSLQGRVCLEFAPSACLDKYHRHLFDPLQTADIVPDRADCILDITAINLKNACKDVIIAFHVLEHVSSDIHALSEIHRVLDVNGIAILCVPMLPLPTQELDESSSAELRRMAGYPAHVRICGPDYIRRIDQSGFLTKVFDPWKVSDSESQRYGLAPPGSWDGTIFVATKR